MSSHRHPSRLSRRAGAAFLSFGLLGVAALAPQASAQQVLRMNVTSSFGGVAFAGRPAMNAKELDNYAEILGLDDTQKEAAKELLSSYTAEFEKDSKAHREAMRKISEEFNETRDDEVWQQMGPLNDKHAKRSKELEDTLLSDLKSLCTDKQADLWPKVERTRRRDRTIDRGSVSGESMDLFRVVKNLALTPEQLSPINPQLDSYEFDLDKALIERNKLMDDQRDSFRPGRQEFDVEKMQKQMADIRGAGEKVRDVNQRYARAISSLLPDGVRERFDADVKRATFPSVYKQTRTHRALDAALKFDDLDAKQKEAIASLKQAYEQEIASLNDRWAAALVEEEKDSAAMALGGGGMIVVSMGDDEEKKPSTEPKKARREADKKALQNLEALLNDTQKEKLPKGGEEERTTEGGLILGAPVMIGR